MVGLAGVEMKVAEEVTDGMETEPPTNTSAARI
jgi:hypothetical protein